MKPIYLLLAFVFSVLIHVGGIFYLSAEAKEEIHAAQGEGLEGFEIGLGQIGSYENAIAAQEKAAQEKAAQEKAAQEKAAQEKAAQEKATQEKAAQEKAAQEKAAQEKAVQEKAAQEKAAQEKAAQEKAAQEKAAQEIKGTSDQNRIAATGSNNDSASGGKVGNAADYFVLLQQRLNQFKTYPAALKKAKKEGITHISFSIDKQGNVISAKIKKSSGHQGLDDAALALFQKATPLPPIPDFIKKDQITLAIPIEYSLITD